MSAAKRAVRGSRTYKSSPSRKIAFTVPIDATAQSASKGGEVRHAHMHRTRSIDYAIVLSGEIWAVMDVGETKLVAGDVLVQRGTNHAWANRSDAPCIIAFVLIDAKPLG